MTNTEQQQLTTMAIKLRMATPRQAGRRLKQMRAWVLARNLDRLDVAATVGSTLLNQLALPIDQISPTSCDQDTDIPEAPRG